MSKEIRLIVDSVFEDLVRIITFTTIKDKKTIDTNVQALATILQSEDKIIEGRSYRITFENIDDLNSLLSGTIDKNFKPKGDIKILDTTKQDLRKVRKLQKRLGLR